MRRKIGFTLMEILVTLAIAGILAAASVGTWRKLQDRLRAKGSIFALTQAIRQTRSEAVRRNRFVGIRINFAAKTWQRFIDNRDTGIRWFYDTPADTVLDGGPKQLDIHSTFTILKCNGQSAPPAITNSTCDLVFYPSGATQYQLQFDATAGTIKRTVTVQSLTGLVRIQ